MCGRPRNVQRLASTFLHEAVQINVGNPDELSVNKDIVKHLYEVLPHAKVWKRYRAMYTHTHHTHTHTHTHMNIYI